MSGLDGYKYLREKPGTWRKQLWFKGRNMSAWHMIAVMRANGYTPEQAAKDYHMPLEAVFEAIDYYQKNKALIEAEVDEEGRRLREAGLLNR